MLLTMPNILTLRLTSSNGTWSLIGYLSMPSNEHRGYINALFLPYHAEEHMSRGRVERETNEPQGKCVMLFISEDQPLIRSS